ncbi:MAG: hypothetical protein ACREFP_14695 [Acetobacteraceae bacterium]
MQPPVVGRTASMWHCFFVLAIAAAVAACVGPPYRVAHDAGPVSSSTTSGTERAAYQIPPFGPTIVSQIHNAPGWQRDHTYTYASRPYTRVVNGPGWNAVAHTYDPGQPLNAYQLTSSGRCTSGVSGGPTETGTAIADGTCTWKYVSTVDYISITGWAFDNRRWETGTTYHFFDYVTSGSPLRAYALADDSCTSTVPPAGNPGGHVSTPPTKITMSDGCHWYYMADILYSSERSYIPTVTMTSSKSPATIHMKANYEAELWNDRPYIAGEHGERAPIILTDHEVNRHGGGEGGELLGCEAPAVGGARRGRCHRFIITAAPGESFADSLTPADPLHFDPRAGVAIENSQPYRWPFEPAGFFAFDPFVDIIGLQFRSVHGAALFGYNEDTIRRSILVGGSTDQWTAHTAVWLDAGPCVIANSLIVSHGTEGVVFKYPGIVLHDTIVSLDHFSDSVGIETGNKWVYHNTIVADTAIFGFKHAGASENSGTSFSSESANNATDAPPRDSGDVPWMWLHPPGAYPVRTIPGTTYGASMSSAFVRPGSDWRARNGGPLIGKGSAFGSFSTFCNLLQGPRCATYAVFNFDSRDIIGTPRPKQGRYDVGAWQSCSSPNAQKGCVVVEAPAAANP